MSTSTKGIDHCTGFISKSTLAWACCSGPCTSRGHSHLGMAGNRFCPARGRGTTTHPKMATREPVGQARMMEVLSSSLPSSSRSSHTSLSKQERWMVCGVGLLDAEASSAPITMALVQFDQCPFFINVMSKAVKS